MAHAQETQQEKEARWDTQRRARDQHERAMQAAYTRKTRRMWGLLGTCVVIVAGVVTAVLFAR